MKINEKLFADVLSGELKGTFVLKNGFTVKSNRLSDSNSTNYYRYRFKGFSTSFTALGKSSSAGYDIINFITDTDMKENELTIEIPNGKIVDWDESKKQNKIVLKDKQLTYEDICKKLFNGNDFYFICANGTVGKGNSSGTNTSRFLLDVNNATTKHQLECILAKNQLATVAKYLNNGWKLEKNQAYCGLVINGEREIKIIYRSHCHFPQFAFKTEKLAQQAIEILGEETVKLALEPLGI